MEVYFQLLMRKSKLGILSLTPSWNQKAMAVNISGSVLASTKISHLGMPIKEFLSIRMARISHFSSKIKTL